MTVISQPTYKADTERGKEEFHSAKGEPIKINGMYPDWRQVMPSSFVAETTTDPRFISPVIKSPLGITGGMMPPTNLKPHPALTNTQQVGAADFSPHYNPNAKPILALSMPDGSNLIVAGRTRHQIALADKNCKAVKVTLIDYDPAIHTDEWVQMTNAGEHIINRTATTEHFRTYFTHNPITHAQAIEQGLVPIDPKTGQPTAAYIKGRQEAERILAAKAEADAAAAAAEAKAKAEKTLPGKTKWTTPSAKAKPLSDSETKQTLVSVAAHSLSKSKNDRFQFTHTLTQRKGGTEYTVATDARRLTVIYQPTYKEDTDDTTQEWHSNKGKKSKENQQAPKWTQVIPSRFRGETTINFSYYSFLAKGLKGKVGDKHIDSPLLNNGQYIVVKATDGYLTLNPIYVRDAYKQVVDLGKQLGFTPIVKLQYNDTENPVMFTAEHNGIKWQYVLMPINRQGTEKGQAKPGDIILGEQPSIYGEEQTAFNTATFSLRANLRENIYLAANRKMKSNKLIALCSCPTVLQMLGEKNVGVVTTAQTIRKMHATHGLSEESIYTSINKLDTPAYVFKDKNGSYVFIPGVIAKNAKGVDSDIEIPIILERAKDGSHYIASAYALDDLQKVESWLKNDKMVYAKTLQAQPSTNGAREVTPDFERLVVGLGSTDNVLTEADLVNFKFAAQGVSDSFSAEQASTQDILSQQETSVSSLSLRRSTARNWKTLLSERERTLLQTADYINRQAQRTARVLGADTELQRAGVHFAQATAIITALDKYIFSQDYITRGSAEYRKLRALRNYAEQYISVARKGKLPTRRATKDGRITVKAAIRELLENQLPEARETAAHTIEKKGGNQKTEKELTSELIARLANQNATEVIAEMLQTMGDIINTHLRNSILDRITTSLKTLRPKTNPYGRAVRNTIDSDTQYRLGWVDTFLNLTRAERATWEQAFANKEQHLDQLRQHLAAPPTERQPLPEGAVKAAYDHLV